MNRQKYCCWLQCKPVVYDRCLKTSIAHFLQITVLSHLICHSLYRCQIHATRHCANQYFCILNIEIRQQNSLPLRPLKSIYCTHFDAAPENLLAAFSARRGPSGYAWGPRRQLLWDGRHPPQRVQKRRPNGSLFIARASRLHRRDSCNLEWPKGSQWACL